MIAGFQRLILAHQKSRPVALFLLVLLAGCATRVTSSTPGFAPEAASLARPTRVLVAEFDVDPSAVRQDQGIAPRLRRSLDGDARADRTTIAREAQSAIGETILDDLRKAGLPAERAPAGAAYRPGDLVVTGRILRIDEGNRTRRMGIGLGAGKSIVEATADLSAVGPDGPPVPLRSYDGKADSGRRPGLAMGAASAVARSTAALAAVSAAANLGGEARRSPVGREAASLGHLLAHDIGGYAAERGWIAPASVPPWTR